MIKKDLLRDGALILVGTLLVSVGVKYICSPAELDITSDVSEVRGEGITREKT